MNANACQELKIRAVHVLGKAAGASGDATGPVVARLVLGHPDWPRWTPGQFVMVRPPGWGLEPLWGRPFSIHRLDDEGLSLLMAVVGRGTSLLAAMEPGQTVAVWGPLGNGFAVRPQGATLLLAGGIGLAPFAGYAARHPRPENLRLLFGHTAPLDRFPYGDMAALMPAGHCHDQGRPGDIPDLLAAMDTAMDEVLAGSGEALALACGPEPFLRAVQRKAAERDLPAQLSLENRMACGVGACLGCVTDVPGKELPVQVCSRGPVFWAHEVILGPAGGHKEGA